MARRNMIKIAESAGVTINHHYDMSFDEMGLLYAIIKRGFVAEAIITAFRYGFILGRRSLKAERKNKKPRQCANTDRASRKPTTERA